MMAHIVPILGTAQRSFTALILSAVACFATAYADEPGRSRSNLPSEVLKRAQGKSKPRASAKRARRDAPARQPAARWLGQDGHDFAGTDTNPSPSDVQDIHFALAGLPPDREIAFASIRPHGGGEWQYKGPYGPWGAVIIREPGSRSADLYVEPYQPETGRPFTILLRFDTGQELVLEARGGKADPNLRMPNAALQAKWVGQVREDRTGLGPSVGPDGIQDVRLSLSKLSAKIGVKAVTVLLSKNGGWQSGMNPKGWNNAEFLQDPNDRSKADVYLSAEQNLAGRTLEVVVDYDNGKTDRARLKAGRVDPKLAMPLPAPVAFLPNTIRARWLGQDGTDVVGPGDAHVALENVPAHGRIVAASLSNQAHTNWSFRENDRIPFALEYYFFPLAIRPGATASQWDLFFPPERDESGCTLTLRLLFEDGKSTVFMFPGGKSDPGRRAGPGPAATSVVARPGDNLNDLAERFGKITLSRGSYALAGPLVLNKPVTISAEPGATLTFSQAASAPPWDAAIEIHAGHTTLEGFAVRFSGPVRWTPGLSYGPSVIRMLDGPSPAPNARKGDVNLVHLDLESPPPSGTVPWEEAAGLARFPGTTGGRIENNILRGGTIQVYDGPWLIQGNEYRGTLPGTSSPGVFACHGTHDLIVRNNTTHNVGPSGKTWRFLVLASSGNFDVIEGNRIEGIGPRDDDTIPSANAPEIMLTESYSLHFEGKPLAVSKDGRVLQVFAMQGHPAHTGDIIAILGGAEAGTWRRVVQVVDPTTCLVDPPLPAGDYPISIATGFVDMTFADNRIDARGGSGCSPLVLVGNHFGTRIRNNHLLGGGDAFKLSAAPTEHPTPWGWSHAPFVGVVIEGNIIEDSRFGGLMCVEHGVHVKSNRDRVYLSAALKGNTVVWTDDFLRKFPAEQEKDKERFGIRIGQPEAQDPGESLVTASQNDFQGPMSRRPAAAMRVYSTTLNGKAVRSQTVALPSASRSAAKPSRVSR